MVNTRACAITDTTAAERNISTSLTSAEYAVLEEIARRRGITKAQYLREQVRAGIKRDFPQ